jgi:hypothetical protein
VESVQVSKAVVTVAVPPSELERIEWMAEHQVHDPTWADGIADLAAARDALEEDLVALAANFGKAKIAH